MTTENNDPFESRNGGKRFEIGDAEDGGTSAMFSVGDSLLIVTKKSIYALRLADNIDPERTNPAIPDSKQKILAYGSDEPFVCRTLLQAHALLGGQGLPKTVDSKSGLSIGLNFLKEMTALHELVNDYVAEEEAITRSFNGRLEEDQSFHLPSIPKLEQKTKQFVNNADYSVRNMIELAQLFYPFITKNDKKKKMIWAEQLRQHLESERGISAPITEFASNITPGLKVIRSLRNATEHITPGAELEIVDYSLTRDGHVKSPTILYNDTQNPLPSMPISKFMVDTLEYLHICFEELMAHLCNVHATPFAGDIRSVVEIPENERRPHEAHVRFCYHIEWTK